VSDEVEPQAPPRQQQQVISKPQQRMAAAVAKTGAAMDVAEAGTAPIRLQPQAGAAARRVLPGQRGDRKRKVVAGGLRPVRAGDGMEKGRKQGERSDLRNRIQGRSF